MTGKRFATVAVAVYVLIFGTWQAVMATKTSLRVLGAIVALAAFGQLLSLGRRHTPRGPTAR